MAIGIMFARSEGKYCDLFRVKARIGSIHFKLGEFILRK